MATDPPVPDLGAQDPHLAELYRILARGVGTYQPVAFTPQDAAAWLQHVDAQAARLAAHQAVLERLRDRAYFSSDPYSRDYAEWIDAEMATLDPPTGGQ
jgi:hypothetical protein